MYIEFSGLTAALDTLCPLFPKGKDSFEPFKDIFLALSGAVIALFSSWLVMHQNNKRQAERDLLSLKRAKLEEMNLLVNRWSQYLEQLILDTWLTKKPAGALDSSDFIHAQLIQSMYFGELIAEMDAWSDAQKDLLGHLSDLSAILRDHSRSHEIPRLVSTREKAALGSAASRIALLTASRVYAAKVLKTDGDRPPLQVAVKAGEDKAKRQPSTI